MKIIAITQARVGSTRLPGKVLKTIGDKSLLAIHIERILRSKLLNELIVATTHEPGVSDIIGIAKACHVRVYQGSTSDVLDRFYQAANIVQPEWIVRITSDCPLIDPQLIDAVVESTLKAGADYGTNTFDNCFPDGQDIEVFSYAALKNAWENAQLPSDREHVTPYIRKNTDISGGNKFRGHSFSAGANFGGLRMTVDEEKDLALVTVLIKNLGEGATWEEYAKYILDHDLASMNSDIIRNEGYLKSLKNDKK